MAQIPTELPRESRAFASKIARSIADIQPSVNNMADVLVFLEVLGYNESDARKHGFESLRSLAKYVYNFIDAFEERHQGNEAEELPVSRTSRRLKESLSMVFPWLGSLILLALTGVSLWMAWGLPADVTTAFLAGVFAGLAVSEGLAQNLHRLFSFYYSQTNVGEVRRSIQRNYALAGVILCAAICLVYAVAMMKQLPFQLASITVLGMITISLHRLSYVVLYSLKKLRQIGISYFLAFGVVLGIYFLFQSAIPDPTARYLGALGTAFGVLSGFAAYYHYKLLSKSISSIVPKIAPHFYSPISVNDKTLTSNYRVQLWESLPYFLYGSCYFIIIFADRVISWIFNPHTVLAGNGSIMPFAFNSIYHAGADLALLIVIPVAVLQYVLTEPVYALAHNKAIRLKVREIQSVDKFIGKQYRKLIFSTVFLSIVSGLVLNVIAPQIIGSVGGNATTSKILFYSSIGAVLLSIFAGNAIFMIFLGRTKALALISIAAAITVIGLGFEMAQLGGFQNAVIGYVGGTALAMVSSTLVMARTIRKSSSFLFARFI
jgi:Putative exopolysaccharide Exporter (EPS-E)